MTFLSRLTAQGLRMTGIGLASLFLTLPAVAQTAPSIAEIASTNDSFETLESLLTEAGWLGAFDGTNGKVFTIFAPTDEAFARLPEGTIESLLKPENRELLYSVLAYHVVGGSVTSDKLSPGALETKHGGLPVQVGIGQTVTINNATVQSADIAASNGVVHVVDMVLIPPQ